MPLLLLACGKSLPKNVLPKDKMEDLMWDVAQGGEFVNGFVYFKQPSFNQAAVNNQMLEEILKIHHISKTQFNKSLEYYQSKPDELVQIFDSIIAKKNRAGADSVSAVTPDVPLTPPSGRPPRNRKGPKTIQDNAL